MSKTSRIRGFIASFAVAASLGTAPVYGQSTATGILELVQAGDFDGARAALEATPHTDIDALFLEAQIFTAQGQATEAVKIYRAILAVQPGQIEIRQVLARTLLAMGDFEAAKFHFRELLEKDRRDGFKEQYASVLRQIEQNSPSGVSASLSFVPSTNINRGTTNTFVQPGDPTSGTISESGKETSGIGLQVGVSGFYKIAREKGGVFTLTASATQVLYSESVYNVFQPSVAVRFENGNERGIWSAEMFARRTFRRDLSQANNTSVSNSSGNSFGVSLSGRRALNSPNILTYSALIQHTEFDTIANQSGPVATFKLGLQRNVNQTTAINVGASIGRGLPQSDSFKYRSAAIEAGISKTWTGGWATYTGVETGTRWYDADFGFTGLRRNDRYLTVTASVLNSTISWQGFSPRLSCSWQTNSSNIGFYDFDATECNILLTRGF